MAKYKATIQYPKTPKLRIFKTDDGKFAISYGGEDPLSSMSEKTNSLDKEIQRLFGYSGWQEYKEKNSVDLKKAVKRDQNGRIIQAPTVHPFHVAYGLEEFFNNFDTTEYEVVGIPKSLEDENLKFVMACMEANDMRDSFFGSKAKERNGIINIAMYNPEEGLENKNVITRVKEKYGEFEKVFDSKFQGTFVVRHPNGLAWKANAEKFSDVTSKTEEVLTIDIKQALKTSTMLKENKQLEEGFIRDFMSWFTWPVELIYDWAAENIDWVRSLDQEIEEWKEEIEFAIGAIQIVDPTGLTSWPDVAFALDDFFASMIDPGDGLRLPTAEATAELGFAVLAIVPFVKYGTKGAKAAKLARQAQKISRRLRRMPGNVEANRKAARKINRMVQKVNRLDPGDYKGVRKYADELDKYASTSGLSATGAKRVKKAAEKLRSTASPWRMNPGQRGPLGGKLLPVGRRQRQIASIVGDTGLYILDDEEEDFGGGGAYDPGGDYSDGGGFSGVDDGLPDIPISVSDIQYYVLPKGWRKLGFNWLTRQEKILAQRIGANSEFSMSSFVEPSPDDQQTTLEGANILVFGHSQAQQNHLGGQIIRQGTVQGAKVKSYVFSGHSDGGTKKNLVSKLDNISPENFTHAFLFLGGNTAAKLSGATLMADAKKKIIDHMVNVLNISKSNILVVLPPINTDNEYSRNRKELNAAGASLFKKMGVKVHPQITGNKKDFRSDGYHISGESKLAKASVTRMLANYASRSERRTTDNGIPVPYGYVASELGYSRTIWDMYRTEISKIESGGNYGLKGGAGKKYDGRYQIGGEAKQGGARRFGIPNPGHGRKEREAFRADPALQEKIFAGLTVGNHKILMANSKKYKNASSSEKLCILAYAHNLGAGGASRWLRTGIVGKDGFGTKGTKFYYAIKKGFKNLDRYKKPEPVRRRRRTTSRTGGGSSRVDLLSISRAAKANNMKYFGNEAGRSSGKFKSTYNMRRPTAQKVARALGHIPYTGGGWFSKDKVSNKWISDNIVTVSSPISYSEVGPTGTSGTIKTHKVVAPHMLAAIAESRRKYGLPLTHIGSRVQKGKSGGFSAHVWGAAIDLDAYVNPYTVGGLLNTTRIRTVLAGGNYRRYWNFKNSRGRTYKNYLQECLRRGKKAISLYEFVGGPLENNGIGKIFNKHGFRWGADWKQARKDVMHFEFMPHYVKGRVMSENVNELEDVFILTEENIDELV